MTLAEYMARQQKAVEAALDRWVPGEDENPATIHRAMRYSLFAGGKLLPKRCRTRLAGLNRALVRWR
jgi:geranylgeranyl pyrophosphate synthase